MTKNCCFRCRYWEPPDEDNPGECRRNPPTIDFVGDEKRTAWPVTESGDWCGEFDPKKEQTDVVTD